MIFGQSRFLPSESFLNLELNLTAQSYISSVYVLAQKVGVDIAEESIDLLFGVLIDVLFEDSHDDLHLFILTAESVFELLK